MPGTYPGTLLHHPAAIWQKVDLGALAAVVM